MPDLTQELPTFILVRETTIKELPAIVTTLNNARAKGDVTEALPYFFGVHDIPGAWLTSVENPLTGAKAGIMVEMLYRSCSDRFPSWKHTVNWAILIDRSHRLATREECLAFFAAQERRKKEMVEANLRLRKTRSVQVEPVNKADFGGGSGETLEALRERVALLREAKKLEGK